MDASAEAQTTVSPRRDACAYCSLPLTGFGRPQVAASQEPLYCCFGCRLASRVTRRDADESAPTALLTRLGLAIFLTMAVMVFNTYLYGQELDAASASQPPSAAGLAGIMRYLSLLFATPVLLLLGWPIAAQAAAQWHRRLIGSESLILVGVTAAFVLSYVSTLRDAGPVYFETAAVVLVLMTLGRYFEAHHRAQAARMLRPAAALLPAEVTVLSAGAPQRKRIDDLAEGDLLILLPGERLSADGLVERGGSHLDASWITGESSPVAARPGDALLAGCANLEGRLEVRLTAVAEKSFLGRIFERVEQTRRAGGRYERLADRVAHGFVPLALVLSAGGAWLGFQSGGSGEAVIRALSVLLIACPCALGIATPLATWAGVAAAAARGAVLRDVDVLEALARVRAVAFDKTGTLTGNDARVHGYVCSEGADPMGVLACATALAESSTHPFSRAIAACGRDEGAGRLDALALENIPGRGVKGIVGGVEVRIGSAEFVFGDSPPADRRVAQELGRARRAGCSLVALRAGDCREAVFVFDEALRPSAESAIRAIERLRCTPVMLTGDHPARAQRVASLLGMEARSGLLPDEKLLALSELRSAQGRVAMVGDGLNDAPALAFADVGVAMGCGTDLTRGCASVCLTSDDPALIPELIAISRRTIRTIRLNLVWAFAYNLVGIGLAMAGSLRPAFAAVAMIGSSLFVVGNSVRVGKLGSDGTQAAPRETAAIAEAGGSSAVPRRPRSFSASVRTEGVP
ncbi:MAG: cation-translocating P-type ATPase [Phycisphaerales bacterium]|nr:cation-translocating P-type ATPase [Phycisphaerales bacterium]